VIALGPSEVLYFGWVHLPYGAIGAGVCVVAAIYYLVWKYFVNFFNGVVGIAKQVAGRPTCGQAGGGQANEGPVRCASDRPRGCATRHAALLGSMLERYTNLREWRWGCTMDTYLGG